MYRHFDGIVQLISIQFEGSCREYIHILTFCSEYMNNLTEPCGEFVHSLIEKCNEIVHKGISKCLRQIDEIMQ